jgi:hypothetical protein
MRNLGLLAGLAGLAVSAGCAAPNRAIRASYATYNETIHFNQGQELLLNLVRLKYRESPLFLKVGALSASYAFQSDAGIGINRSGGATPYGITLGGSFSDRPTITYTPIEGNTFVKQVLAEISTETFVLLYRSGWPMRTLCHVLAERIEGLANDEDHPTYEQFRARVDQLHQARKEDRLELVTTAENELYLQLDLLDGGGPVMIPFTAFQLRSFLDVLFFLGKNTEIPAEHQDHVRPSPKNGWLNIRSSPRAPDDAMVWVEHHGWYFSIASSDVGSKDTFALIKLLFQIQAGDIKTVQPILTLPVAQPG